MKKKIYLAMLAVCFALTASACGDGGAVITDGTKTEGAADGKKAETGTTRLVSVENVEKYITIGEYKGLTLDNTVDAITDDDVQAQIDEDLKDKAEPVSDAAKEGDLVTGFPALICVLSHDVLWTMRPKTASTHNLYPEDQG